MVTSAGSPRFGPGALRFLKGLARNNEKPWFEAHRAEYETEVRTPLRALVEEMDLRFARFAPEMIGDPKRHIFRIHRDVRFSKDKSPYKTHASCWFPHRDAGRRVGREATEGSAGFYFHLQPGECFLGAGIWMPPRTSLTKIRDAIMEDTDGFVALATDRGLRRRFGRFEDPAMLKRTPRGYDPDHRASEWLRYQSFTLGRGLTDAQVTSTRLPALLEADYARLLPLVRWLNRALGLPPANRR